jgi:hypothetical protein
MLAGGQACVTATISISITLTPAECSINHCLVSRAQLFAEAVLQWGSEAVAGVTAALKLPLLPTLLRVPLAARRLQLSAHARITVRPLLEEWPYAGKQQHTASNIQRQRAWAGDGVNGVRVSIC